MAAEAAETLQKSRLLDTEAKALASGAKLEDIASLTGVGLKLAALPASSVAGEESSEESTEREGAGGRLTAEDRANPNPNPNPDPNPNRRIEPWRLSRKGRRPTS